MKKGRPEEVSKKAPQDDISHQNGTKDRIRHIIILYIIAVGLIFMEEYLASSSYAINVTSYGANGLDKKSDKEAFRAALQQAMVQKRKVYIPNGTYDLDGLSFTADEDLVIVGQSKEGTILKRMGGLTAKKNIYLENLTILDITGSYVFKLDPVNYSNVTVKNVIADNQDNQFLNEKRANSFGIYDHDKKDKGINNLEIRDCKISHFASYAFRFTCHIKSGSIINNVMKEIGHDTNKKVIALYGGKQTGMTITAPAQNVVIRDNVIEKLYSIYGTQNDSSEAHAILFFGSNIKIENNTIRNLYGGGREQKHLESGYDHEAIYIKAPESRIIGNKIENGAGKYSDGCIAVKGNSENVKVLNNEITSVYGNGIFVEAVGNVDIMDNKATISGNALKGKACLYITEDDRAGLVRIKGNHFVNKKPKNDDTTCVKIEGVRKVEIYDNYMYSSADMILRFSSFAKNGVCNIYRNEFVGLNSAWIVSYTNNGMHRIVMNENRMAYSSNGVDAPKKLISLTGNDGACTLEKNNFKISDGVPSVISINMPLYSIVNNKFDIAASSETFYLIDIYNVNQAGKSNFIEKNEVMNKSTVRHFLAFRYADGTTSNNIGTVTVKGNKYIGEKAFIISMNGAKLKADNLIVKENHISVRQNSPKIIANAEKPINYVENNNQIK